MISQYQTGFFEFLDTLYLVVQNENYAHYFNKHPDRMMDNLLCTAFSPHRVTSHNNQKWHNNKKITTFNKNNEGGNAVVEVESYYKKQPFSSETQYECHVGAVIAGTALRGKVVKLAN